jgi:hypothetical protein
MEPEQTPATDSPADSKLDRATKIVGGLAVTGLWLLAMIRSWWLVGGVCLLAVMAGTLYLISGTMKLRFSLRTLLLLMLWAGACGTLLTKIDQLALFAVGLAGSLLLAAFLFSSIVRATIPKDRLDAD